MNINVEITVSGEDDDAKRIARALRALARTLATPEPPKPKPAIGFVGLRELKPKASS